MHNRSIWVAFGLVAVGAVYCGCTQNFDAFATSGGEPSGPGAGGATSSHTTTHTTSTHGSGGNGAGGMQPMCSNPQTDCDPAPKCFDAVCTAGVCDTTPSTGGTCTNSMGDVGVCDGSGNCVECLGNDDCSGKADACNDAACDPSHICIVTPLDGNACGGGKHCITGVCGGCENNGDCTNATNCQDNHCNTGTGRCDPQDKNDGDACNSPVGAAKFCDGSHNCTIECKGSGDCPATGTSCKSASCDQGAGTCGTTINLHDPCGTGMFCDSAGACTLNCFMDAQCGGTTCKPASCDMTNGTCKTSNAATTVQCQPSPKMFCDGGGNCTNTCAATPDCPVQTCKTVSCAGGMCAYVPATGSCPGGVCDPTGTCVQCVTDADCGDCATCDTGTHKCGDSDKYATQAGVCDATVGSCSGTTHRSCVCNGGGTCLRKSGEMCGSGGDNACAQGSCIVSNGQSHQGLCGLDTGSPCSVPDDCATLQCSGSPKKCL